MQSVDDHGDNREPEPGSGTVETVGETQETEPNRDTESFASYTVGGQTRYTTSLLSEAHRAKLERAAIHHSVYNASVRTVSQPDELPEPFRPYGVDALPAMLFTWHGVLGLRWRGDVDAARVPQLRPDDDAPIHLDSDVECKYLFGKGQPPVLDVHPQVADRLDSDAPLMIVEGTKQHLAAVSNLGSLNHCVLGMSGCWGWSSGGEPIDDLDGVRWEGRNVVLVLDADLASNRDVYEAAKALTEELRLRGAASVAYARIPAHGDAHRGLDDLLGRVGDPARQLERLIAQASADLPKAPAKKRRSDGARFFDQQSGKFLPVTFHRALAERYPMALASDGSIALYSDGAYRAGNDALRKAAFARGVAELLGEDTSRYRTGEAESFAQSQLYGEGRVLSDHARHPVMNVRNGLVDLRTGRLYEHSSDWLSATQLPVEWDAGAMCPTYERWIAAMAGDQVDDLEEVLSTMLDPSSTPSKAAFLFGPSKSGKGTVLRLAEAVAGSVNTSAVSLQALSDNRFARADLYGKMLNSCPDLSDRHVSDLSIFKMLTGQDTIRAERKFGQEFKFTNSALFVFASNNPPTVSEESRAYRNRIKPFEFAHSFAGAEDRAYEDAMMAELPGVMARWVRAWQRLQARGRYLDTDSEVSRRFENSSDQVARWADEECQIHAESPDGRAVSPGQRLPTSHASLGTALYERYKAWAQDSGGHPVGRNSFYRRLTCINEVQDVRVQPSGARGFNLTTASGEGQSRPNAGNLGSFSPTNTPRGLVRDAEGEVSNNPRYVVVGEKLPRLPTQPQPGPDNGPRDDCKRITLCEDNTRPADDGEDSDPTPVDPPSRPASAAEGEALIREAFGLPPGSSS